MTHARTRTSTEALAMLGDRVLLSYIVLSAIAAVVLGFSFVDSGLAIGATVVLLGAAVGVFAAARYSVLSRFVLAFVLVAFVVLHIQLARGMEEMHFGVFVSLALFLTYRDWRVIVFGAVLFAVHHVVFDRLQAAGFGLYCISEPDFGRIVIHAVYVII
ncbi:MAG: chemotaxis protein, partial [Betaproteobacteria bacterium]|nr:chemotaxis protein [Betaproteobacteria bacterium]